MKLILFVLVLLFSIVPVSAVDWHDDSRFKRVQLNVNNSAVALTDYQLMKNITYDSDMQPDFDDLLFYNESGGSIPYWIESKTDSGTSDIWLKIPSISTTEGAKAWMYYNNSTVGDASNGNNVFELFDDFDDGSIDTSKWNTVGTPTESDGVITCDASPFERIESKSTFGINTKIKFRGYVDSSTGNPWFGYRSGTATPLIEWYSNSHTSGYVHGRCYESSSVWTTQNIAVGNWATFEIKRTTNNAKFSINGAAYDTITSQVTENSLPVEIVGYDSNEIKWDWVFVAKYTSTEPTWAADGEEESYEAPPPTLNGTYLYPNSTYSIGYYGSLTSELVYETGINMSDIYTSNLLSSANMEYLSIDDTNYIPSIDKDAAHDGYMYGNFSLSCVESVNFITVKTVHNRVHTNPVILGLFNMSTQKWHAVNNSSVETVDVELTYNITGTDIAKYTTLENKVLNLSVSLNTNGDGNYDVFVDFVEVYIDYEEVACPSLECVYNLVVLNQNNISILQNDVDDLENSVNNLYLFVLLCTVFLVATLRKRGDTS